ncbi:MAG: hypothetical protein WBI17_09915 [Clostridiaceae bacterium]
MATFYNAPCAFIFLFLHGIAQAKSGKINDFMRMAYSSGKERGKPLY